MAKTRDLLPPRLTDPLWRARNYISIRSGLEDPARRGRLERRAERQPILTPPNRSSIVVEEGDAFRSLANTIDFDPTVFDITESPVGEANIALAPGGHGHTATITRVTNTASAPNNAFTSVTATCPANTLCTGGGCQHNGTGNLVWWDSMIPAATTYSCGAYQATGGSITLTAFVMCQETPIA